MSIGFRFCIVGGTQCSICYIWSIPQDLPLYANQICMIFIGSWIRYDNGYGTHTQSIYSLPSSPFSLFSLTLYLYMLLVYCESNLKNAIHSVHSSIRAEIIFVNAIRVCPDSWMESVFQLRAIFHADTCNGKMDFDWIDGILENSFLPWSVHQNLICQRQKKKEIHERRKDYFVVIFAQDGQRYHNTQREQRKIEVEKKNTHNMEIIKMSSVNFGILYGLSLGWHIFANDISLYYTTLCTLLLRFIFPSKVVSSTHNHK